MEITRVIDAKSYNAPNHRNVASLRIQGWDATNSENFWVGLSTVKPGGGAGPDKTPFEKVYIVVEGELLVITDNEQVVLEKYDSCRIMPNEERVMKNETDGPVKLIVVIPYPDKKQV